MDSSTKRDPALKVGFAIFMAVAIAAVGWIMIMNPLAGGLANAFLPWLLFKLLRIDPTLGTEKPSEVLSGAVRAFILMMLVLVSGMLAPVLGIPSPWSYVISSAG